jgi:hypothetical protein
VWLAKKEIAFGVNVTYETAITRGWEELAALSDADRISVPFLNDTYEIDIKQKSVSSLSCNVPTKDYLTLILQHYLIGSLKNNYTPLEEWVSFKDIEGGEFYYPAYRESVIKPLLRKYGEKPEALLEALKRFKGEKIPEGDIGIRIETFEGLYVKVLLWKGDDEFAPEATMLYDRNITRIFTMEDVVVFSRFITHSL